MKIELGEEYRSRGALGRCDGMNVSLEEEKGEELMGRELGCYFLHEVTISDWLGYVDRSRTWALVFSSLLLSRPKGASECDRRVWISLNFDTAEV